MQLEDSMVKCSSVIVNVHDWNQEFMPHGLLNAPVIFYKPQKAFQHQKTNDQKNDLTKNSQITSSVVDFQFHNGGQRVGQSGEIVLEALSS